MILAAYNAARARVNGSHSLEQTIVLFHINQTTLVSRLCRSNTELMYKVPCRYSVDEVVQGNHQEGGDQDPDARLGAARSPPMRETKI